MCSASGSLPGRGRGGGEVAGSTVLAKENRQILSANPDRTRSTRYAILDDHLNFWFTFVHPYQSRLEREADIIEHLDSRIMPRLDEYVSHPAFERACRQRLRLVTPADLLRPDGTAPAGRRSPSSRASTAPARNPS